MPLVEPPPGAQDDSGSLDALDESECWRLLATQQVGRVAVIVGHYPLVFPVNYALDGEAIVFRTGTGTKLRAIQSSNVTFEVDEIDVAHRAGWSVMVSGTAEEVGTPQEPRAAEGVQAAGVSPWAPGEHSHLVRVVSYQISGRRIRPTELADPFDRQRYL
jgi:nitroimidazol reductase NimA-like FMN-containing flavoprotein (pyridoxamine 5'-phosphate oxidase superfamily)